MVQQHIDNKIFHIEILTPKQSAPDIDAALEAFAQKYRQVMDAGYTACITDNPMGIPSFQATEVIAALDLPVHPEQLLVHLNTFHTREGLDEILKAAVDAGMKYLLVISGDGSERLPKLTPESLGIEANVVTSVELLQYIGKAYPGAFHCGVAFNPYEPQDHELEKMERKVAAGAQFIITQPVIGRDERVLALRRFGLPVIIDAWMSKKLHLLSDCVGYAIPEDAPYDPIANLQDLQRHYPDCGFYLALLGFKTQYPLLKDLWK
jgi:methylenetetrahydrofolate reductase (NADPH)